MIYGFLTIRTFYMVNTEYLNYLFDNLNKLEGIF